MLPTRHELISRNSPIPIAQAQVFTTFQDGQNAVDVHVAQGEREMVSDCRSLARFKLTGIPAMPAGMARVEVRFAIDADGILTVSAKEQTTGAEQKVTVKPTHGLTDEEIEQMLLDSIENAEADVQQRLLVEQQVDAKRVVIDARKQLENNGDLLSADERTSFTASVDALAALTATASDHQTLKDAITSLDDQAKPFVERIMNRAITTAAVGHRVEDF